MSITTLDVGAHLHRGHSGEQLGDRTAAGEEAPTSSSDVSVGRAISNLTSGGAGSSEGCGHEAGEQGVVGGASVTTNGGAIRVDSLAGSAVLDSGGGPIKVSTSAILHMLAALAQIWRLMPESQASRPCAVRPG